MHIEPPLVNHLRDDASAKDIIDALGLAPHPEGGFFRETWRDAPTDGSRGAGTAIYFLLARGQRSHWHRVDATEIWHWHAGTPLRLSIADGSQVSTLLLGPDLAAAQRPQAIVPAGAWQSAEAQYGWALLGCTVSPAFQFSGFELAPPDWSPR